MTHRRLAWWLGARFAPVAALLAALGVTAPALADTVDLVTSQVRLRIDTTGGLPVEWVSCAGPCDSPVTPRQTLAGDGMGHLQWVSDEPMDAAAMAGLHYTVALSETAEARVAVLTSVDSLGGAPLVQRYELSRTTHHLHLQLVAPPGVGVAMANGAGFIPPPLPGFGAAFTDVTAVYVSHAGQADIGPAPGGIGEITAYRDGWAGIRNRFWAWLARPAGDTAVVVRAPAPNVRQLTWRDPGGRLDLDLYGGPVEWKSLRVVAPDLSQMLFASLWEPLRWLCFGLLFLLGYITRWVVNPGAAIILLSLVAKILLLPLTRIADRWQQEVNRAQSRLQPRLDAIGRQHRGEEAHQLTLAAYRDAGVHPLYTLKSLAGFAIQVPMFIAAFDMLADNFALDGARFLWISDLAAPDRFMALPLALPFFGSDVNLLPFIMTGFTVLSAIVQRDASLSAALRARQQRQLYLMAGGFFLLFYTFPSGMVLYWTANNVWHFIKIQGGRLLGRPG